MTTASGNGGFTHFTQRNTWSYERSENWSRTTIAQKNTNKETVRQTFGTVIDNTTFINTTASDVFETQESWQSVFSLTKTRNVQTSTTQQVPYTSYRTATATTLASEFSTSKNNKDKIDFVVTPKTASALVKESYLSTGSATITTQLTDTELDPDFYATVCRANQANMAIWVLGTSTENAAKSNFVAATKLAESGIQVTLHPWTETIEMLNIGATDGNTNGLRQTGSQNEISTYFELQGLRDTTTTEQTFETSVLPWQGAESVIFTKTTESQSVASIVFSQQYVVATKTAVEERVAIVPAVSPAYFNGGCNVTWQDLIGAQLVTGNVYKNDTNALVSFSIVSNRPNYGRTDVTSFKAVGYALKPQAMTTAIGSTALIRLGLVGPIASEKIGGYLQCPNVGTISENYLVSANRENAGSSRIFPGTYSVENETGKGTISFSGISASITFNEQTSSFVVGLGGNPNVSQIQHDRLVAGAVADFESCAVTVLPGVYSSVCGQSSGTFSTSGGAKSFTTTSGKSSFLEPMTFVCPAGTDEDMGHVVWTANYNQTDLPTA